MKKKIFSTALSVVLALSLCPAIALADTGDAEATDAQSGIEESVANEAITTDVPTDTQVLADVPINTLATTVASGELGTCTWTIDSDGCLTIAPTNGVSGTFEMENPSLSSWPWYQYKSSIVSAKVEKGVSASGSLADMFYYCDSLTSLDLSGFDTSNVTSMKEMFRWCGSLASLDLTPLNTSSVTDMSGMFDDCSSLTSLDLSPLDTSNVTNMSSMFGGSALTFLDLTPLDTSNVTNISNMFYNCDSLTSANLTGLDTSNITDMRNMFCYCRSLTSIDLSTFDTSNVTNMAGLFYDCFSLNSIDLSTFDTSNVTNMADMFENCSSLTSANLSGFDTSNVTNMSGMFQRCSSLTSLDVSGFNTSNVTSMYYMFNGCSSLTSLDLKSFNTSNITSLEYMFNGCSSLTSLDVSSFNTPNVTDMLGMFEGCSSLITLNLKGFNTSRVRSMFRMFAECASLTSLDLSSFDTPNLETMGYMFENCSSLKSVNLSTFDTSNTTFMEGTFSGCSSLISLDLSNFVTSSETNMGNFFNGCKSLCQVKLADNFVFGEWKSLYSSDIYNNYLPIPTKNGVEGKWRSSVDGRIYDDPSELPSNVAATYTAVFSTDKGGFGPIFSDVFTKISANNWYYDAIYFMASIGIINGYGDDTFGVGQSMTRADLVVIIWRYYEPDAYEHYDQSTATNTSGLPDVPNKEYYTGAVNWAVANGVITGYDLGNGSYIFAPDDAVTFDQMVTIVARYALGFNAAENYNDSVLNNSRFTDGAVVEDWARGSMAWAINNSVVNGSDNGNGTYTLAPLDSVARERGATVLARSIQSGLIVAE